MHLVNEEYDSGEILSQIEVPVLPDDSVTTLEARVKETEKNSPCCSTKRAVDKQKLEIHVVAKPSQSIDKRNRLI